MLGMTSCITPMLFPWVHMIMKDDNEARSFTAGAMVSIPPIQPTRGLASRCVAETG